MGSTAVAFCPGNISGFFRRLRDPERPGSCGAGLVVSEGVLAEAVPADVTSVSGRRVDAAGQQVELFTNPPVILLALDELDLQVQVRTKSTLPVGAGFGMSAAATLASLAAANAATKARYSRRELASAAHRAEVAHLTGLGDVVACCGGGMHYRTEPGVDASVDRIFSTEEICAVSFGPLPTPDILSSPGAMQKIQNAWPDAVPGDLSSFFELSRIFSEKSGLITPDVRRVLDICNEEQVPASMTMLGNGVFAMGPHARRVLKECAGLNEVYAMSIADQGFHVIEEE